jgi:hypothetical protein
MGKYAKCFLEYDAKLWTKEVQPVMARVEDIVVKGSNL